MAMAEDDGTRCVVGAVRAVAGSQWIGSTAAQQERWWGECWSTFLNTMPANLLEWITQPAEETVYDEQNREVKLVVEGVARVPDCLGHAVGST
jgi:hypothetical protein